MYIFVGWGRLGFGVKYSTYEEIDEKERWGWFAFGKGGEKRERDTEETKAESLRLLCVWADSHDSPRGDGALSRNTPPPPGESPWECSEGLRLP